MRSNPPQEADEALRGGQGGTAKPFMVDRVDGLEEAAHRQLGGT